MHTNSDSLNHFPFRTRTDRQTDTQRRTQQQPPFYSHYTGQPVLAGTSRLELEDSVGAKFYCPHALAEGHK